jgi:hypothetical protein
MNKISDKVSFDALCTMAGVRTMEDFDDNFGETYSYAYKDALANGMTEDEAEDTACQAEGEERDEACKSYHDAVMHVCDKLFAEHHLTLVPIFPRRAKANALVRAYEFRVVPEGGWNVALSEIRQTINGVGVFQFASNRELCESGPWPVRQAVLHHLHWIFDWTRVYEGGTTAMMIERRLR